MYFRRKTLKKIINQILFISTTQLKLNNKYNILIATFIIIKNR